MIPAGGNILDILTPIPPPPGVQSNLKNPEDDGFVVIIVGSILVGIMMVFLIVRLYAKILVVRRASWDDCELLTRLQSYTVSLIRTQ